MLNQTRTLRALITEDGVMLASPDTYVNDVLFSTWKSYGFWKNKPPGLYDFKLTRKGRKMQYETRKIN